MPTTPPPPRPSFCATAQAQNVHALTVRPQNKMAAVTWGGKALPIPPQFPAAAWSLPRPTPTQVTPPAPPATPRAGEQGAGMPPNQKSFTSKPGTRPPRRSPSLRGRGRSPPHPHASL
ncbi:unnamed protein product [Pipistrellus nathusii]|uniref:Uncharacterized protein n=1 Tax=Pipistrellus nathusii TaxID=59473 RepID=A0ABP0AHI1_PIPNA